VSDETQSESGRLSPELARGLEQACDRFEAAWQGGPEPRLEDYFSAAPPALRPALLRELVLLDIHYRQSRGQACSAAMYRDRFPEVSEEWLVSALAAPPRGDQPSALREQPQETGAGHEPGMPPTTAYPSEGPGGWIGPYKLLQKLGEGGMGTVYVAQQEKPVARRVALKIIKAGMDSSQVIARFEQERQALALMDHPNIAKVLDAGTTDAGRPYFVMELVKGIPVTKFCDLEHLTPRERLDLFIPICHAVQHAHQKGIIHRDLKPSNVIIALYDGKPVPKVIDFGVAKATSHKLTERTVFTEVGQMVGTLEYMAPEQAELNNLDIDTRADIYALGVLLYELLTGGPPFTGKELRSMAFAEMLRMIREVEPQKPSTKLSSSDQLVSIAAMRKVDPARLTKLLAGDLDWIVMKALDKERGRRYDTANALALDILRHLHDEPVLATPPGAGYRLRKFARRHPAPIALAAVSLVAALAVVGLLVAQFYNSRLASINVQLQDTTDDLTVSNGQLETASVQLKTALQAAQAERARARRYLYVSQITLADRARQEGQIARMMQLLRSVIPEGPEEEDLRRFEWFHLWREYHGEQSRLRGHSDAVTAVAFSPDGRLLASGSADRLVKLWNLITGKETLSLNGHEKGVTSLAFSPDGSRLVSGSTDKTVSLWDTSTGQKLHSFEGHAGSVTALAYGPDGRFVVSGSTDKTTRVWDASTGRMLTMHNHSEPVTAVAFSPGGKTIASVTQSPHEGNYSGEAILWNAFTGVEVIPLEGRLARTSVAFSPDGKHLVTGELAPTPARPSAPRRLTGDSEPPTPILKLYNLETHKSSLSLQGHTDAITGIVLSPDGKRLVSASLDRTLRIWDVATARETSVSHDEGSVLAVAISPDGRRIAAGSGDRTVKIWSPPASENPMSLHRGAGINSVAFSPDGKHIAASSANGMVTVWDARTERELRTFKASQHLRLAWSPDGRRIGVDGEGRFVSPAGENSIALNVSGPFYGTAFSADGKLFATTATGVGGAVRVWDPATGACLKSFPSTDPFSSCVAFSPDNKWLASGSGERNHKFNGSLTVWDLRTGKAVLPFDNMKISVWAVTFSPDGNRLAAATGYYGSNEPGDVYVWETATGRELYRLKGHVECAWSVVFSPDGHRLASAAGRYGLQIPSRPFPGEVKIWDMIAGQELLTIRGHTNAIHGLAFSPSGYYLATGSADGTVRIWDGMPLAESPQRNAKNDYRGFVQYAYNLSPLVREACAWLDGAPTAQESALPPDALEVRRLIQQLGSPRFEESQDAAERIQAIGEPAWWPLQAAGKADPNLEIRRQSQRLAALIGRRAFTEVRRFAPSKWGRAACNRIAYIPDGRQALAAGGAVSLNDLGNGRQVYEVWGCGYDRRALAVSRDGRYFLTGHSGDGLLRLYDVATGNAIRDFVGHTVGVQAAAFSPDGTRAISGGDDGTLRVWDVSTGKERRRMPNNSGKIWCVAYSLDSRQVLSGHYVDPTNNYLIVLWDVESGKEVRCFAGHQWVVTAVVFMPDGQRFLSASMDGTLRLWSLSSGRELLRMEHRGGVDDVAASPDGRLALSAGFLDKTVRLWDLQDGTQLHQFEGHSQAVLSVAISPDGLQALSSSADGAVCLWRLPNPGDAKPK
jgi:WD40 repeat protein/serine/threonine protein kinase